VILRRLRVHPFGRFADREVAFGPGLTVVLGPNEAGKSTLWYAIRSALLRPSKLTRPTFQQKIARFVPVDGGDVACVDVTFAVDGDEHVLSRRWGTEPGSELRRPHGGPLRDEKSIQEAVAGLLPASPATVGTVLMVRQSDLGDSVLRFAEDPASLDDVSALLRRVVQETGGVSVDVVRRRLADDTAKLYAHWDRGRGAPEGGRGIEQPWKKEVGEVLAAWYAVERLRVDLAKAGAYERDLDVVNRRIEAAEASLREHERFVEDHAAAFRDAGERRTLEARLAAEKEKRTRLSLDTDDWPVREAEEKRLAAEIAAAEGRLPALVAEQQAAEAEQAGLSMREKAGRVQRLRGRIDAAATALATAAKIDRAAFAAIQAADREVERGRAAGGLVLSLKARAQTRVKISPAGGTPSTLDLAAGESRTVETGSSFVLGLGDLDVAVGPAGTGAADPVEAARRLAALLAAHGLASVEAAEAACGSREGLVADLERASGDLAAELAGEPLETFAARAAALEPAGSCRPLKDVARDLAVVEASLTGLRKDREKALARAADLSTKYGTRDRLHAALGESVRLSDDLEKGIAACAPLPAGFADGAALVAAYEAERTARERAKDGLNALIRDRVAREAAAPDQSVEELEGQHADARARFAATLSRAKAVDRVAAAVEAVAGSDEGIFAGLADEVARRFSTLSLGAHPGVVVRDKLPRAVRTATGAELPWEWLSAGAKDLLGLAVRLAMAGVVIGESGGFLLLDDPLVDLDPERQAAAAAALCEFASGRQTIVFTCHPTHAELLGGELVRLD